MLSRRRGDKHLLFLVGNNQKQIPLPRLRDRDDIVPAFFNTVLELGRATQRFVEKLTGIDIFQGVKRGPLAGHGLNPRYPLSHLNSRRL